MTILTEQTTRRLGYTTLSFATLFALGAIVLGILADDWGATAFVAVVGTAFLVAAGMAMRAQPSNGAVWALTGAGWFGMASSFGSHLAAVRTGLTVAVIEEGTVPGGPADYDTLSALGINVSMWAWIPSVFLLATVFLILFPDGKAPSQSWRALVWIAGGSIAALSLQGAVLTHPWREGSYQDILAAGDGTTMAPPIGFAMLILMAVSLAAVGRTLVQLRKSTAEQRLQYRWVTWAVGLYVIVGIFAFSALQALGPAGGLLNTVLLANIPISMAVAITKYRLYDIDVVISRTLVAVVLVGFITLVYAAVVVGVGSLVGGSSVGWSIVATALVAVVFEPVRDRVQRWVNRLVLGRRATPYEVLSDLTGRLAATEREEGLLDRMAQRLVEGTGADRAIVWTADGARLWPSACAPVSDGLGPVEGVGVIPGAVVPISHEGEVLGALSVESRRGDALTPTEQRLVEDLAGSAGLLMRRLRLDAELEQKAQELEESRRRLVGAQDVERRRLERELNEGAQQQVVALKVQLAMAEQQARGEGSEKTAALLAQMSAETQDAIDQIQALANGIYPPLLEAEGLATAVRALGELAPVEVRVDSDVSRRYPLPLEGAVYFCVSEALTNAVKHGEAPIRIDLSDGSGELVFSVADSGSGFDPGSVTRGAGLNNMTDRLDALEGAIAITSRPGTPTRISGRLPVAIEAGIT